MDKHTPGPWGFGNTSDDKKLILGDGGKGRYICSVQIHQTPRRCGYDMEKERLANARLIAAAPELLEACKHIQGMIWKRYGIKSAILEQAIAKAEDELNV